MRIYTCIRRPPCGAHGCEGDLLSTVTVHSHKPADSVLQSVSSVLYPSFNGSPADPGPIKYHQKKNVFPSGGSFRITKIDTRAFEGV